MTVTDFPRVLLLTSSPPDWPYAGGEVMRKIVRNSPEKSVRWAYLRSGAQVDMQGKCFPSTWKGHWRLHKTLLHTIFLREIGARRRAREIARWIADFGPEVLWVHAEEEAVNVAFFLKRILRIPLHLTFHDAPEVVATDFIGYSRRSVPFYLARVKQLVRSAESLDAVSAELVAHVKALANRDGIAALVLPPSATNGAGDPATPPGADSVRRIGICGSPRVSEEQWSGFLAMLGELAFNFEIVAFVDREDFFRVPCPGNTTMAFHEYAPTEADVVRAFVAKPVVAGYLGLWRDESKSRFCRTSLSSKLATYAAAGLPVIVDGPRESVAWSLVEKYDAGVLYDGSRDAGKEIEGLLGDPKVWRRKAAGMRQLQADHLDLGVNIERFKDHLAKVR